jgi:hypothetical protein
MGGGWPDYHSELQYSSMNHLRWPASKLSAPDPAQPVDSLKQQVKQHVPQGGIQLEALEFG